MNAAVGLQRTRPRRVPTSSSSREALLEHTFALYWRHLTLWMGVLLPVAVTAASVYWLAGRAVAALMPAGVPPQVAAAVTVMPRLAAALWLLAGVVGAQVIALRDLASATNRMPPLLDILRRLLPRFAGTLATSTLVIVHVAALGALGAAVGAGLAGMPLSILPRFGASQGTSRSVALLLLLPLLVAGVLPAVWWLGRHAVAIPLQTLEGGSPWATLRTARAMTRGRIGSVLGLFIVTSVANSVLVLLCRAAGSLVTLLVAPDRFRPIFGEGPLRSTAGAGVQLAATLVATFVTLPLVLLPFAVLCLWLRDEASATAAKPWTPRG
jgi:hypothetical protein